MFEGLPHHHFGAILCDPPWQFKTYSIKGCGRSPDNHYETMSTREIMAMPVEDLAAPDCALFMWATCPMLIEALSVISTWGFRYKTMAFVWVKAHAGQIDMFRDDLDGLMGNGYWTRSNAEFCLLATRGRPKRLSKAVRQAIVEPRREHSRKPDCVYGRVERLVAGPRLELFARSRHPGWTSWGNETDKFAEAAE